MKIIITENQYKTLFEEKDPQVLKIPGFHYFNNDWDLLVDFLNSKGNPRWTIGGNLDLRGYGGEIDLNNLVSVGGSLDLLNTNIKSLGNLQFVGGYLDLSSTNIKSLGNLQSVGGYLDLRGTGVKSLGILQSVGGFLDLDYTKIESLGNLQSVGWDFYLRETPISKKYSKEEIRQMVNVGGDIYM